MSVKTILALCTALDQIAAIVMVWVLLWFEE